MFQGTVIAYEFTTNNNKLLKTVLRPATDAEVLQALNSWISGNAADGDEFVLPRKFTADVYVGLSYDKRFSYAERVNWVMIEVQFQ